MKDIFKNVDDSTKKKLRKMWDDAVSDLEAARAKAENNPTEYLAEYDIKPNEVSDQVLNFLKNGTFAEMIKTDCALRDIRTEITSDSKARELFESNPGALLSQHGINTKKLPAEVLSAIAGGKIGWNLGGKYGGISGDGDDLRNAAGTIGGLLGL